MANANPAVHRVQQHTVALWEHLYRQATNRAKYRLDLRKNHQQALLDNFVKKVRQGPGLAAAGRDYLARYFAYQFGYWSDKTTENTLSLAWVIGTKAWERWRHAQAENGRYWDRVSAEKMSAAGFVVPELSAIFTPSTAAAPVPALARGFAGEEADKRLYHNTDFGLFHCLATTTLYVACPTCIGCVHRLECRRLLALKYPSLHTQRFPQS